MSYGAYGNAGSYIQHRKASQRRVTKKSPTNKELDYNKPPNSEDFKGLFTPRKLTRGPHKNFKLFPEYKPGAKGSYVRSEKRAIKIPSAGRGVPYKTMSDKEWKTYEKLPKSQRKVWMTKRNSFKV